jgi:hypothetical protein
MTIQTRQRLNTALFVTMELVVFFWLGLATQSLEQLAREVYSTSFFIIPAIMIRLGFYYLVALWIGKSDKVPLWKPWSFLMLPTIIWFSYRMISSATRWEFEMMPYFLAYLIVESLLCLAMTRITRQGLVNNVTS